MNILIADDERIVLEGLKHIIDWNALGFDICATAENGAHALEEILSLSPDLVLLDIRMPQKNGIEVVQEAVEAGYTGKFIILSGVSDFKLAQAAMRYGVDFYLTKPIDEDELEQAVLTIRSLIERESKEQASLQQYRDKARQGILKEILLGTCDYRALDLNDLHLYANIYQVVSYENYNQEHFFTVWNFADMMRVTNQDNRSFDILELEHHKIILLKGDFAISRFERLCGHFQDAPQKGSPFDSVFIAYGPKISRPSDIPQSYTAVCRLLERRFFCAENQHILGYGELQDIALEPAAPALAASYAERLSDYIKAHNRTLIARTLQELDYTVRGLDAEISAIKHHLIDIYILVKQNIMQLPLNGDVPFLANATAIDLLERKYYLYEIIQFLAAQFELWMHAAGSTSGENVLDEVFYYIHQNYKESLKLERIAPLFGYNSSYLGKIFCKKAGVNFNAYVDKVRIDEAKKLLAQGNLKIYEIAGQIGYSSVDYFHKKFKKYVGMSPAEYRKTL